MYTDDPIEVPKVLIETLCGPATVGRDTILEEVEQKLLKLVLELNQKKATITDISGPVVLWELDKNKKFGAKYELLLLYTQQPTELETYQARANHRKAVEKARARNVRPDNMPKFVPLDQIQRSTMTQFGTSHTSVLVLILTVAYFFPSMFTHTEKHCENYPPLPLQLCECDTLRTLGKKLWDDSQMRPILRRVEAKLQAWEKRRLVIEQNIRIMTRTMR